MHLKTGIANFLQKIALFYHKNLFFAIIIYMENKKELINQSADLIAKGDFKGAAVILEKIYTDDEKNTEIIKNLGLCYINIENYQKAAAAFKKALAQDPKDATALFYLANCNDKLGFEDKAIE